VERRETLVPLEPMDPLEHLDQLVPPDLLVHLDLVVRPDLLVPQDPRVLLVLVALLVLLDLLDPLDLLVSVEKLELLDTRDTLEFLDFPVCREPLDPWESLVHPESKDNREPGDCPVPVDPMETMDLQDPVDLMDQKDPVDHVERVVDLDPQDLLDPQDPLVCPAKSSPHTESDTHPSSPVAREEETLLMAMLTETTARMMPSRSRMMSFWLPSILLANRLK